MPKKRSAAGSGSIRKKAKVVNGKEYASWEGRVTVGHDPATGKQVQKYVTGKTQREVAQKLRQLTSEIDKGVYITPSKMDLDEWLDIWSEQYLGDVKSLTREMYKSVIRAHLKPSLGKVKLASLKADDIQRFYVSLQKSQEPLSPKTIKNIHGVLHKALQQAVDLGYIRSNPSESCKLPRVEKASIKPFDDDTTKAFLQAIQGDRYENLFLVTLFTGMRQGEVLGLSWDNVNFDNGTILVGQQLQNKRDGTGEYALYSPKNGKSRRITPAPFVMDILRQQQVKQAQWKAVAREIWEDSGLVFTNESGGHLATKTVYKAFKRLAAQAGYPEARFHDLRHSYAVAALQSGDDIKTVQETLGHYTAAFTLDVYGHVTEKMQRESANRMQNHIEELKGHPKAGKGE